MFTADQKRTLLRPLNASRVVKRNMGGQSMSYLAQHDVRAHLIRLFGFGGFDLITEHAAPAYEHKQQSSKGSELFNVGYLVTMRLVVRDPQGDVVCEFSESSVGSALSADRGEAHDNAVKNGASDAMKRCAINLGDQFGLSLYERGQTAPIVRAVLVGLDDDEGAPASPEKAPVSDERYEQGSGQGDDAQAPQIASVPLEVAAEIANITATQDNGQRILAVFEFKKKYEAHLEDAIEVDGQLITLDRYLALVAAGQFTERDAKEND